jgi:hypothetical protein
VFENGNILQPLLCVSAVRIGQPFFNRRDAENAEEAQRRVSKKAPKH